MLNYFRKLIALDNPLRLFYHKIKAVLANIVYRFPSRGMVIIGVTGTNGKTTTSNIIGKGLVEAGEKVFMFTTVNYIIDGEEFRNDSKMTSPDPFLIQRLFAEAKKKGCTHAVIETASHGITMHRTWGLDYDIAVLTNITQDHLDLHGTMEKYVNTKLQLFKSLIRSKRKTGIKKTAVINVDSDYQDLFMDETYDSTISYGVYSNSANLRASDLENLRDGTNFRVSIPGESLDIKTQLMGDFNIYNIMAAIGVFTALGIKSDKMHNIVENIEAVPGRLEAVENKDDFRIYVDYAHTADALTKVLEILEEHKGDGRLICVFGATGDRDKSKRPVMGRVVSKHSDIVFLTQDDDYTEVTENIIKDVLPGIERKEGEDFWVISDRAEAIRTALLTMKKGDTLLVAGKGDEHSLMTNEGPKEWHDRTFIESILKDIDENKMLD